MTIKIIEPIGLSDTEIKARLKDLLDKGGHHLFICDTRGLPDAELVERVKNADVILLSNRPLSSGVIDACPNLKLICVAFTGIDHVDQKACKARGIVLRNAAGYAVHAVSELAIGLMIAVFRRIVPADFTTRANGDNRDLIGRELFGKTLGVVGCGAIGLQVARLGEAFGCRVLGFNRGLVRATHTAIEQVELNELLSESDIVSLHLPLTNETRGLIGRKQLALMKPSAILINTARGPIVDEPALIDALSRSQIAGAGLDVFDVEPPLHKEYPIFSAPNTVLLPHVGFDTVEAIADKAKIALDHLEDFLTCRH